MSRNDCAEEISPHRATYCLKADVDKLNWSGAVDLDYKDMFEQNDSKKESMFIASIHV